MVTRQGVRNRAAGNGIFAAGDGRAESTPETYGVGAKWLELLKKIVPSTRTSAPVAGRDAAIVLRQRREQSGGVGRAWRHGRCDTDYQRLAVN